MKFKVTCPRCAARLSRWHYFSTTALDYRCRRCGARFRMTAAGWAVTLGVIALQGLWFLLALRRVLPMSGSVAMLLLTCGLALWLLPYLTPVKLGPQEAVLPVATPDDRR